MTETAVIDFAECTACGRTVRVKPDWNLERLTCGALLCRARVLWGPEDWEGAARMATARAACGIELTELDLEALQVLTDLEGGSAPPPKAARGKDGKNYPAQRSRVA